MPVLLNFCFFERCDGLTGLRRSRAGVLCDTAMRIGVNAPYLIPGGVGGTEIYLRSLLDALAGIDAVNQYLVFTNRETGRDLAPAAINFQTAPQPVRATSRIARILW